MKLLAFSDIYQQLMLTVNRPLTESSVLAGAKWEINQAIKLIQRNQAFVYTERLSQFDYAADTLYYNVGTICDGVLRDIMSVQILNESGKPQGRPIKVMTYNQVQAMRMNFDRTHPRVEGDWYQQDALTDFMTTIESGWCQDKVCFIAGQNIGIYPTPQCDITLLLSCHIWLPDLVEDGDTNFLLTYGSDVVLMAALRRMHIYMKSDGRFQVTNEEFQNNLQTLVTWDSQVKETPNTTMSAPNR